MKTPFGRKLFSLLGLALLNACSSTIKLSPTDAAKLQGAKLALVQRELPSFKTKSVKLDAIQTGAAFVPFQAASFVADLAGGKVSEHHGRKIAEGNQLEDPANQMSQVLTQRLAAAHGISSNREVAILKKRSATRKTIAHLGSGVSESLRNSLLLESPKDLAAALPGVDYVLDISTTDWALDYYMLDWNRSHLEYRALLRVIDLRTAKVIAKGEYEYEKEKTKDAPTKQSMLANQAVLLKQELQTSARLGAEYFGREVFGFNEGAAVKQPSTLRKAVKFFF